MMSFDAFRESLEDQVLVGWDGFFGAARLSSSRRAVEISLLSVH